MKTVVRNILLIIILSIEISSLKAQSFHFTKVPPIGIPQFSKIYIDPTDSFWTLGVKADGGYGYYKSTNGTDWYPTNKAFQPSTNYVGSLIKSSDNYLYSYSSYNSFSLSRSNDSGATWVDISNNFPDTPGNTDSKIFIGEDGVLYLNSSNNYYALGSIKSIIYKSIDHGDSWIKIDESIKQYQSMQEYLNFGGGRIFYSTAGSLLGDFLVVGSSIDSAKYLFIINGLARVGNTVFAGGVDSGMVYSNDTGRTWTSLSSKMFNATNASILFNKGDTFFVSTNLGYLFSYDRGQTWTNITTQYECDTNQIITSVVANSHSTVAINNETGYMIFDPTNNLFIETKLPLFNPMSLYIYGDLNEKLTAIVTNRIYTYSSNEWQPIFCSTTNNIPQPWFLQYWPNFIKEYNRIYFNGYDSHLVSKDNGRSWGNIQAPTMDADYMLNIVGQDSFIYVTRAGEPYDYAYLCDENGNIYQTNAVPPVFGSSNGNSRLYNINKRISLFQQDATSQLSLIFSDDFGKTWANGTLPYDVIPGRIMTTNNYLFCDSYWGDGLRYSNNCGESWSTVNPSVNFPPFLNLNEAIELPDKLGFLFMSDSVIYYINDLNNGNTTAIFNSQANGLMDMQLINNHLYVQTGYNTIWCSNDFNRIDSIASQVNKNLLTVYPVPSQDVINIVFDTSENPISYAIFNFSGEKILNGELNGATQIDIQNLNEGIYFLQIIFSDNSSKYGKFIKD